MQPLVAFTTCANLFTFCHYAMVRFVSLLQVSLGHLTPVELKNFQQALYIYHLSGMESACWKFFSSIVVNCPRLTVQKGNKWWMSMQRPLIAFTTCANLFTFCHWAMVRFVSLLQVSLEHLTPVELKKFPAGTLYLSCLWYGECLLEIFLVPLWSNVRGWLCKRETNDECQCNVLLLHSRRVQIWSLFVTGRWSDLFPFCTVSLGHLTPVELKKIPAGTLYSSSLWYGSFPVIGQGSVESINCLEV